MTIRVCTYNVGLFAKLFDENNQPLEDEECRRRLAANKTVRTTIDADVFGIQEAPNTTTTSGQRSASKALENFAVAEGLRLDKAIIGFGTAGRQELALWYDSSKREITHHPGGISTCKTNPPFNRPFDQETNHDRIKELYELYRRPPEAPPTLPRFELDLRR